MGEKTSNDILSLKVHNRFAPKNSCILLGRVSTKVIYIKNCEISNFGFLAISFLFWDV